MEECEIIEIKKIQSRLLELQSKINEFKELDTDDIEPGDEYIHEEQMDILRRKINNIRMDIRGGLEELISYGGAPDFVLEKIRDSFRMLKKLNWNLFRSEEEFLENPEYHCIPEYKNY